MPLSRHLLLFPILLKWRSSWLWAFIIVIEWERDSHWDICTLYIFIKFQFPYQSQHLHHRHHHHSDFLSPPRSWSWTVEAAALPWHFTQKSSCCLRHHCRQPCRQHHHQSHHQSPYSSSSPHHHHHHVVIINITIVNIIFLSSSSSCLSASSLQPSLLNGSRLSRSRAGVELPAANMKHESTNISRQGGIDLSIWVIAQNFCKNSHHGFCITSKRINMEKMIKSDRNLVLVKI